MLESEIDLDQIAAWVGEDPERQQQLRELASGDGTAELGDILATLQGMRDDLDPEAVATFGALFGADADRERRL